ncbi:MAG TPA: sigma-54 dependent transcriptional regulator [Phycisphaerae bacterium]|nr:sigma-54 dependent transcriptional regulator [Phycisphaerae bacterium]
MSESSKGVLLVVDDEPLKRITLQIELSQAGYTVLDAADAVAALKILSARPVDVVITDLRMPQMDGMQFLEQIKARWPHTHVVLMTAYGSVDSAVAAIKRGAFDYLTKPFKTETLVEKIERLRSARGWVTDKERAAPAAEQVGSLMGISYAARRLFQQIRAVADGNRPVLVEGEAGTGKSLVAQAVHQFSPRKGRPMRTFACSGCEPAALDGELAACFAQARGGTLFLKDIDALPGAAQAWLLTALEQSSFDRPEADRSGPADARLICATTRDLRAMVEASGFRQDLYYRVSAVTLSVPPLRDRREDIVLLTRHFVQRAGQSRGPAGEAHPRPTRISPHAVEVLLGYHWPGNVRELEHVIGRAATLAGGEELELKDILLPETPARTAQAAGSECVPGLTETIAGIERSLIDAALRRAAGNQARAAQFLGIPRTTLRDKMAKYGMTGQPAGQSPSA